MTIFLLTPIQVEQPEWLLSPVRTTVQVIADDEAQARHAAAEQLHSLAFLEPDQSRLPNPWMRVDRVKVEPATQIDDRLPLLEGYMPKGKRGRPSRTSLFMLEPRNLDAPEWGLSYSTDPVCVEARHVYHARAIAALHFDIQSIHSPGDGASLIHPWWSPRLVAVREVSEAPEGTPLIRARDRKIRFLMRHKG